MDVLIVGGGPVGLFLACLLAQLDVRPVVLDRNREPRPGSRAIGIHPPSLARLAELGVAADLRAAGVEVGRGRALSSRGPLGAVSLAGARPFGFVLSVPQRATEAILTARLAALAPGALRRGAYAIHVAPEPGGARVLARHGGDRIEHRAPFVVGCDGSRSIVRAAMSASLVGRARPESYVMGDFADDARLGPEALFFLADDGLVESFPLPGGRRRWVAEAPARCDRPRARQVAALVRARTGIELRPETASMVSGFGIAQLASTRLARGRLVVAGDAAHLISPFGGQGMNLGWADAWDLAGCLARVLHDGRDPAFELRGYQRRRRRAVRRAMRRAALNGAVGRRSRHPRARNAAVALALGTIPQPLLARLLTMGRALPW